MEEHDGHFARDRAMRLLKKADATPSMYIGDISRMFDCIVSGETEKFCSEAGLSGRGLSRGYRQILFHLSRQDGVTQLRLVQLTKLKAPTVSVALTKMEENGLVKRAADEKDLRQVRVFLTSKGREFDDFIRKKSHETEEMMLSGLSPDEKEQLRSTLRRILENMIGEENDI